MRATHRCKGNYFALSGVRAPFSRLIYPLHEAAGLGVHLTLDLGGQGRFGPDTEWLADDGAIDYTVDAARGDAFYAAIRRYWPGLPDGSLQPAYSGVRPKLSGQGEAAQDFAIDGPERARRAGARQPVRHRVAGAHRRAGDRRAGAQRARRRLTPA